MNLRCPICGQPLTVQDRQWVCAEHHSFDIARQGYVNLLPICGQPLTVQDRQWVCAEHHSFDIARQGYVNLLSVQLKHSRNPGDTR